MAIGFLSNEEQSKVKIVKGVPATAKKREQFHPIFEGVTDHKTKYIMMFILGCDQFPKGVPGIGPSHLEALINESYKGALIFVDCWAFVTCYN